LALLYLSLTAEKKKDNAKHNNWVTL